MLDVVGVDLPCIDLNIVVPHQVEYNEQIVVQQSSWQGGGKVATGLAAAARLGLRCAMLAAVGDDGYGRFIKRDFERHGIDADGVVVRKGLTSSMSVILSERKTKGRNILFSPGTAQQIEWQEIDSGIFQKAKWLFVSRAEDVYLEAMRAAKRAGARVFFDADLPDERLEQVVALCDVFIASEFVYRWMFGEGGTDDDSLQKNCRAVSQKGPGIAVFTFGEKGCAGYSEDGGFFRLPAFEVDVVDTVGAGDVYHGAFLAGLVDGLSAREAARYASAVAAIKCTRIGGRAGIPNKETTLRFIETGMIDYSEIDSRVAFYREGLDRLGMK